MLLGCDLHVFHSLSESTWRIIATWTKVILILLAWPWRWLVKRNCLTRFTRHQQISVRLVWSMFLRAWYVSWIIAQSSNCRFCIIVFFHRQFKHILGVVSADYKSLSRWSCMAKLLRFALLKPANHILRIISDVFTLSKTEFRYVSTDTFISFMQTCLCSFGICYHLYDFQLFGWDLVNADWF